MSDLHVQRERLIERVNELFNSVKRSDRSVNVLDAHDHSAPTPIATPSTGVEHLAAFGNIDHGLEDAVAEVQGSGDAIERSVDVEGSDVPNTHAVSHVSVSVVSEIDTVRHEVARYVAGHGKVALLVEAFGDQ